MNKELIYQGLKKALSEAESSLSAGSVPIGCVITDSDGNVIATGQNRNKIEYNPVSHAEMVALRNAGKSCLMKYNPEPTFLFTTVEPCFGCGFFIIRSNIKSITWCLSDKVYGSAQVYSQIEQMKDEYAQLELISEPFVDLKARSSQLMVEYYSKKGNTEMADSFRIEEKS